MGHVTPFYRIRSISKWILRAREDNLLLKIPRIAFYERKKHENSYDPYGT